MLARKQAPFSDSERAALTRVAQATMPAGKVFHAADERCVNMLEQFLVESGSAIAQSYRGLLWALESGSLIKYRRRLAQLSDDEMLTLCEQWRHGRFPTRAAIRAITAPLKVTHFSDPAFFSAIGCKFGALPVVTVEKPRYMTERVTSADALPARESLDCDVVVIGTGAGGAAAAKELAERGVAVVMLEEGKYFTRADFTGRPVEMQRKLYRDFGATISVGNTSIPIPIGKTVGGTTTINSGTCLRAPTRVFDRWRRQFGLSDFSTESMAPYYERVEEVMGVSAAKPQFIGNIGKVIARGCEALGYKHHGPLRRNAPECDGQGVCCFGCPTDAKRSTNVSFVPLALKAGASLFTGVTAEEILIEHGRAVGVIAHAGEKKFTVRAKRVVIAGGTLLTPLLLEKNHLGGASGQLGRNLTIHPCVGTGALYEERIDGSNSIPQGYTIEEFHDEGFLFEGGFAPLDVGSASFPILGPRLIEVLENYNHIAFFGFMLEDSSRGRVRLGPGGRPLITYWVNRHDVARVKRGVEILARVYFASGAKAVLPLVHGFDELRSESDLERFRHASLNARDFDLAAFHPLGTARMGVDPKTSVVGPNQAVHDVPGLHICDGSVLPTSPAVNPQLTIMALATRAAEQMAKEM